MFNPQRLSLARKRRRLTGKRLADLTGLTPVTISRLEKGNNEPFVISSAQRGKEFVKITKRHGKACAKKERAKAQKPELGRIWSILNQGMQRNNYNVSFNSI